MKKTLIALLMVLALTVSLAVFASAETTGEVANPQQLTDAIAAQVGSATPFVKLTGDIESGTYNVTADLYLDLAGFDINGTINIAGGAKLFLLDSATADYIADDYGKVTNITGDGELVDSFVTPSFAGNGRKLRYVTIHHKAEVDGSTAYSAHRIYIAVSHSILMPNQEAVDYRTVYLMDEVLAEYANAGSFGADVTIKNVKTTEIVGTAVAEVKSNPLVAYGTSDNAAINENHRRIRVANILGENAEKWQENAENLASVVCAYVEFADGTRVTSSQVSKTFQQAVVAAQAVAEKSTLTEKQSAALTNLYVRHQTLFESWTNEGGTHVGTLPIHCVCGASFKGGEHADGCDKVNHVWTPWYVAQKGKLPDVAGYWYIADTATINTSTYITNDEVFIDLNDKTVTVGGTYHAFIYMYSGSGTTGNITGSVTITDSGKNGTLKIAEGTKANAGILFRNSGDKVANAKLNIYGGHLDASAFNSQAAVGAIDLGKNAVINMYGGKISGNKNAATGSAVYLNIGATLNMSGNAQIIGGGITNANLGDQKNGGGAVMVNQAYLYMSDNAQIIGGTTDTVEGGSVKVYGSVSELHMSGNASITGGMGGAERNEALSVYSVNAQFYMNGGRIDTLRVMNTVDQRAVLQLQGDVHIGYLMHSGLTGVKLSSLSFVGAVPATANVHVDMDAGYKIVARGEMTNIDWAAFEAIADNVITCPDDVVVTYEADGIYLRPASDGTNPILYHCVCGVDTTPACNCTPVEGVHAAECATRKVVGHLGECDTFDKAWTAWDVVAKQAWPTTGGYYYLTASGNLANSLYIDAEDMVIDLNGQTITVTNTYRAFVFKTSESVYNDDPAKQNIVKRDIEGSLTITDSVGTGTVKMPEANGAGAMLAWNWLDTVQNPQLTIYGGTLDGSLHNGQDKNYGAVYLGKNAVINMYGGTIVGSKGVTTGGAVTLKSGSVMNMSGNATITGGIATNGHGGNVYIDAGATLNMSGNAKITAGTNTKENSANVYSNGTLTLEDNASITGSLPAGANRNDVFNVNGSIDLSDNAHLGVVGMTSSGAGNNCYLTVADSVKIDNLDMGTYGGSIMPVVTITGTLNDDNPATTDVNEGAMIILKDTKDGVVSGATVAENANNFASAGGFAVEFDTTDSVLKVNRNLVKCMCGASVTGGEHALGCDKVEYEWTPITISANQQFNASGNYYLTEDTTITAGGTIGFGWGTKEHIVVRLDLNGHSINQTNGNRLMQVVSNAEVWLCNSKPTEGGVLSAYGENNQHSSVLQMYPNNATGESNKPVFNMLSGVTLTQVDLEGRTITHSTVSVSGEFNMYGGTINGGTYKYNGTIVVNGDGTLNILGGTVNGGTVTEGQGSAIYSGGKSVTIKNATVGGGKVKYANGGAVVINAGQVTLENAIINGAKEAQRGGALYLNGKTIVGTMTGGQINAVANASQATAGAALYVDNGAQFTMNSGTITATGIKTTFGAAVLVEARSNDYVTTFTMKGGTINGGIANGYNGIGGGGVLTVSNGFTNKVVFDMQGGLITGGTANNGAGGGVFVRNDTIFKISGNAQITGNTGGNVYLADGATIQVGTMTEGANVGITMADMNDPITTTASASNEAAAKYLVVENIGVKPGYCSIEGNALYQHLSVNQYHCVCGLDENGNHFGDCQGEVLEWKPWDVATKGTLPNTSGNWYLTSDKTNLKNTVNVDTHNICIDLNGHQVSIAESYRAFIFVTSESSYPDSIIKREIAGSLTITDTSEQGNGRIYRETYSHENAAIMIWNWLDTVLNPKLTIYGGHIDAGNYTNSKGGAGAISLGNNAEIKMFGGTITAPQKSSEGGGIMLGQGSTLIMSGNATIVGGTTNNRAGAVDVNASTLTMSGNAEIRDGITNANHGGNIWIRNGGTVTMSGNAHIINGQGKGNGGNVNLDGAGNTLTLSGNAYITGGTTNGNPYDIFNVNGTINASGSAHLGVVNLTSSGAGNTCYITVADSVRIDNLSMGTYAGSIMPVVTVTGELNDDARIGIAAQTGAVTSATVAENTDNFVGVNGQAISFNPNTSCIVAGYKYYCVCGLDENGQHFGNCDEVIHEWKPWDPIANNKLPGDAGYWYLTTSGTVKNTTYINDHHVYVDLNGQTIKVDGGYRVYNFAPAGASADSAAANINGSLTITDTGVNGTIMKEGAIADNNLFFWNWLTKAKNATFNMYGGILDGSKLEMPNNNGLIDLGAADVTINLFGGQIKGAKTSQRNGGIILQSGNKLNMSGNAEIIGATSNGQGANVWAKAGSTITMSDNAHIINGNAGSAQGGNVNLDGAATLIMSDNAYITGGQGPRNKDVFCVNGTIELSDNAHIGELGATVTDDNVVNIRIADSVRIDCVDLATWKNDGFNGTVVRPVIQIDGILNDDARIGIKVQSGDVTSATVAENVDNFFGVNGQTVGFNPNTSSVAVGGIFHCVCGLDENGQHFGDCDKVMYEWKPWDVVANKGWPTTGGYYYLTASGDLANSLYIDTEDMVIDLNGQTITVTGTYRAFVFQTKDSVYAPNTDKHNIVYRNIEGSLTITDTVGTGTVKMPEANGAGSMLVWNWLDTVQNPQLTIYGGTLDGSLHNGQNGNVGAISLGKNAVINMFGGTIIGSKGTTSGGSVTLATGSVMNMSGNATITGGVAATGHGGNVFVASGATLNMSGNAKITAGTSTKENSANVYSNGTITLEDNASITGSLPAGANRNDVFSVNGSIDLSDNAHLGVVTMTASGAGNNCYLTVADSVKIDNLDMNTYNGGTQPVVTITGTLNDAARIGVKAQTGVLTSATVAENADNFFGVSGQAVSFNPNNSCIEAGLMYHCVCGLDAQGNHFGDCQGEILEWRAWDVAAKNVLPNTPGNWYLTSDKTNLANTANVDKGDIRIDLNGHQVSMASSYRAINFMTTESVYSDDPAKKNIVYRDIVGSLTITDTSEQGNGRIYRETHSHSNNAIMFWNWLDTVNNPKLTIYGGHIDAGNYTNASGGAGAIGLGKNAVIKLFGGTITAPQNCSEGGGIMLGQGSTLIMSGNATIVGGTAKNRAGAVDVNASTLTMSGNAEIRGGISNSSHGGNIWVRNGSTVTMSDNAHIIGGQTKGNGGNVNLDGAGNTLNISGNAYITGGTSNGNPYDIFNVNGTINASGNAHLGVVNLTASGADNTAYIKVADAVKIDSLSLGVYQSSNVPKLQITGTLNDAALIKITGQTSDFTTATVAENADNVIDLDGGVIEFNQETSCLRAGTVIHCLCGAARSQTMLTSAEHAPGCDEVLYTWKPATSSALAESGNYYLTGNRDWTVTFGSGWEDQGKTVRLDLNGFNMQGGNRRMMQAWNNTTVVITNSKSTGGLVAGKGWANAGGTGTEHSAVLQIVGTSDVTILGNVTLQQLERPEDALKSGGVCGLGNGNLTMYGGKVIGGNTYSGGSVFNVGGNCTLTLIGTEVVCGTSDKGGAINSSGIINLKNVSFTGGTANKGSAIYNNGTLNVEGSITMNNGAELYNIGKLNIKGVLTGNLALDMYVAEGRITANNADIANAALITVNGAAANVQKNSKGYLYIPVDTGDSMKVGYGEGSLNPTAQQLDFANKGYLDINGRSPLEIMGFGTYAPGLTVGDGTAVADIDNLKATAIAYTDSEGDTIIMISVDSTSVSADQSKTIRNKIAAEIGVPADNVLISCTHAHSTPVLRDYRDFYEGTYKEGDTRTCDATDRYGKGSLVYVDGEELDEEGNPIKVPVLKDTLDETYYETFVKGVVAAAKAAMDDRSKVTTLSTATVADANASNKSVNNVDKVFNEVRNYEVYQKGFWESREQIIGMETPNHSSYKDPNFLYEKIYKPESAVDASLQIVKYVRESGDPIIITNFQTHPHRNSAGNDTDLTADVVGAYRYALANATGAKVLYFSGAGGNVNPHSSHSVNPSYNKNEYVAWGENLAKLAEVASYTTQTNYDADVEATTQNFGFSKYQETGFGSKTLEERVELAKQIVASGIVGSLENDNRFKNADTDYGIYSSYHANKIVNRYNDVNINGNYTGTMKIYAYQAGPIAFAGAPYEMYDTNGMEIKTNVANTGNYAMTFVATMANGSQDYIPSALGYQNGGYSTDMTPYTAGTGELLRDAFVNMISGMAN